MASETDIAWAAGLFEGEGCFYRIQYGTRVYLGLTLEMTDEPIVRRFIAVLRDAGVGGRSKVTSRWRGNEKHATQHAIKMSGTSAVKAYALIRPYLGERRTSKADAIVAEGEAIAASLIKTAECVQCHQPFALKPLGGKRMYCSQRCRGAYRLSTPKGRAAANARSRRYKERQRQKEATQSSSLF